MEGEVGFIEAEFKDEAFAEMPACHRTTRRRWKEGQADTSLAKKRERNIGWFPVGSHRPFFSLLTCLIRPGTKIKGRVTLRMRVNDPNKHNTYGKQLCTLRHPHVVTWPCHISSSSLVL